ncbi:Hypothetical protein PBC10988_20310 [Planctomycetales bacterium 10988]|nr:Hypothetical protein PBC10988_20310 [Planctomycetales bacterium 10988]
MKRLIGGGLALAMVAMVGLTFAGEALKKGDSVGAFHVEKIGGATEDGVDVGENLCYRCMYGNRPMVMIFTNEVDGEVPTLVQQLDQAIEKNSDSRLASFVSVMGESQEDAKAKAQQLAKQAKHVAITVPNEVHGPKNYNLDSDAGVTVIMASKGKVISTHKFGPGEMCAGCVAGVVAELPKLAN